MIPDKTLSPCFQSCNPKYRGYLLEKSVTQEPNLVHPYFWFSFPLGIQGDMAQKGSAKEEISETRVREPLISVS